MQVCFFLKEIQPNMIGHSMAYKHLKLLRHIRSFIINALTL